ERERKRGRRGREEKKKRGRAAGGGKRRKGARKGELGERSTEGRTTTASMSAIGFLGPRSVAVVGYGLTWRLTGPLSDAAG
ncbi:hypothetical protein ACC738_38605, partial [Rhizobium ruizarguesonis]